MKITSLVFVVALVIAILGSGGFVNAADNSALIAQLQAQIRQLVSQIAILQESGTGQTPWCHTFNTNLRFGDNGVETGALINALRLQGFNYSYDDYSASFNDVVASAVTAFQEKYASSILTPSGLTHGTGYVGPATRAKLNLLYRCGTTQNVIINSVSGPNSLNVGQTGYWTVNVAASFASNLTYSVDWGDGTTINPSLPMAGQAPLTNQTGGFSHVYNSAGNFTIRFTVNDTTKIGSSAQASLTVVVGNPTVCAQDVYTCPNGLVVSRSGPSCGFVCPTTQLTQPSITVTSPNGGEQWVQGSTHNITWRATGVNNVSIGIADFQTGLNIEHTIANVPASNGSYSWTIPSDNNYLPLGNTYKIVISEYGGSTEVFAVLTGVSNKPFTIVAPPSSPSSITVTSPNGGEVWKIGETKNITWQVDRVSMVDIIAKDITGKIYSIDVGILSSRGSYSWVVGKYQGGYFFPAGQYKIEIKNTYTGAGTAPDFSNNYFTVAEFAEFANGVCGPVNGTRVSVSPTTNLCSSGLASSTMGVNNGGSIIYNWLCYGAGGGATVSCSATQN